MLRFKARIWFLLGALACLSLLAMGAYFQLIDGLEPCPYVFRNAWLSY